jgi:hypothetical protein
MNHTEVVTVDGISTVSAKRFLKRLTADFGGRVAARAASRVSTTEIGRHRHRAWQTEST